MAKFNKIQNAFNAGELSPLLHGRTDINEYSNGLETMENFIPLPSGGASFRPGLRTVISFQDTFTKAKLIPFNRNATSSVMYILTNDSSNPLKIITNDGRKGVLAPLDGPLGATAKATGFTFSEPDDWEYAALGDLVFLVDKTGANEPMVITYNETLPRPVVLHFYIDYIAGDYLVGNRFFSAHCYPFREDTFDLEYLDIPGSGAGSTPGDFAPLPATPTTYPTQTVGRWLDQAKTLAGTSFTADDIGKLIRIRSQSHPGQTGVLRIASVSSPEDHFCIVQTIVDPGGGYTWQDWQFSQWGGANNWPRTVASFENRLLFGGSRDFKDSVWHSVQGNIFNFNQRRLDQDLDATTDESLTRYFGPINASDPFELIPASTEVNEIAWLVGERNLQIGTLGGEFIASHIDGLYSETNSQVRLVTSHGSTRIKPARIGSATVFITRDGKTLRDFSFSERNGSHVSRNISLLSEDIVFHRFDSSVSLNYNQIRFKQLAHQDSRQIVWAVTTEGALLGCMMAQSSESVAWHKHTHDGKALSVATITNATGSFDDLYVLMERTIDGNTEITLEKMLDDFQHKFLNNTSDEESDAPVYLDASEFFTVSTPSFDVVPFGLTPTQNLFQSTLQYNPLRHGFFRGQEVEFTTTGTLPAPLATGTTYYIVPAVDDPSIFGVASSLANALAGTTITITTLGGGGDVHTVVPNAVTTTTIVSDLWHLEGETVSAIGDGTLEENLTVTNGDITLSTAASRVIVGLPYEGELRTLPIDAGQEFGSAQGEVIRIDRLMMRFYKSLYAKFAQEDGDDTEYEEVEEFEDVTANETLTADAVRHLDATHDRKFQVIVKQDKPYPCTLTALVMRGQAYD